MTVRDASRAAMLAAESVNLVPTTDGADALQAHLALAPRRFSSFSFEHGSTFAALSRDGRSTAALSANNEVKVIISGGRTHAEKLNTKVDGLRIALDNSGVPYRIAGGHVSLLAGKLPASLQESETVLLSPNGANYATIRKLPNSDREIMLQQVGNAEPLHRWIARAMSVPAAFSSNGLYFAFVNGNRVTVVDVAKGTKRYSSPTDMNEITAIAVDDSGDAVLVFGWKPDLAQIVRLRFQVQTLPTTGQSTFRRVYLTPDGKAVRKLAIDKKSGLVAIEGGPSDWIWVGDYYSGNLISLIRTNDLRDWTLTQVGGNPTIVTASRNGVSTWSIARNSPMAARPPIVRAADIGPTAALGAFADRFVIGAMHKDEPREWFVSAIELSGKKATERKSGKAIESIIVSPMGHYAALTDVDGFSEVRSLPSLELLWRQPPTLNPNMRLLLAFSPNDGLLAWGSAEIGVRILDLRSRQVRQVVSPLPGLTAIAVAPNGSAVAWTDSEVDPGCKCVAVRLRESGTTQTLGSVQTRGQVSKPHLAFDRKGERLVVGLSEGMLRIWTVSGHKAPRSYLQEDSLDGIVFSFDGEYLITRGKGRTHRSQESNEVAVWKLSEGRRIWRYLSRHQIAGAVMSRDGRYIVIAEHTSLRSSGYLAIRVETLFWRPADLLRIACDRFRYRLSTDERAVFLHNINDKNSCR